MVRPGPGPVWQPGLARGADARVSWPVVAGLTVGVVVLAPVLAYRETDVVHRAWSACEISSETAYGFQLGMLFLLLIAVNLTLLGQAVASCVRRLAPSPVVVLVTGVLLLATAWALFAWAGLPVVAEPCPGGEPGWWPAWLPPLRTR